MKLIKRQCECGKVDLLQYRSNRSPSKLCHSCRERGPRNPLWKGGVTPLPKGNRNCGFCGTAFKVTRNRHKFCCEKCLMRASNLRHKKVGRASRRAKEQSAVGSFSRSDFVYLIRGLDNHCPCCEQRFEVDDFSVDHIVPLSMGGTNYISNIQPLCIGCNVRKNARIIDYIRPYLFLKLAKVILASGKLGCEFPGQPTGHTLP